MTRFVVAFTCSLALTLEPALALSGYPQIAVPALTPPLNPTAPNVAWDKAAGVKLGWNVLASRPASETTTAAIATDGKALFVRFDAAQ
ncbi:MAG: hypothetical protein JOZ01_04410, partial [Candidatus Eremiobacteraeota bacterium]|nr:hypothetical protein [Candidatus Eremiobacteraeota bacterium]